jgi:SAM-dependent methyltransferase
VRSSADYVFGDTGDAARRLDLLAEAWAEPSAAFLHEDAPEAPRLAIDLGCGPGHTTRLVASTTGAARTIGLDNSQAFLARARADAPDGVEFLHHDVVDVPFPHRPADLVYSRFVLSHAPRPLDLMPGWMDELAPGGVLALDEVEWIRTDNDAFRRYLELLEALFARRGSTIAAGPIVEGFDGGPHGERRTSAVRIHPVPAAVAAKLFVLNLRTWRAEPHVRDTYSGADLDGLDARLRELARRPGCATITWGMRQATFERPA